MAGVPPTPAGRPERATIPMPGDTSRYPPAVTLRPDLTSNDNQPVNPKDANG